MTSPKLVVEVPQRGHTVANLVTSDRFEVGAKSTQIDRSYDDDTRRVTERFVVEADGVEREFDLAYRLYDSDELVALFVDAGFVGVQLASSLAIGDSLTGEAPTIVAVAATPE